MFAAMRPTTKRGRGTKNATHEAVQRNIRVDRKYKIALKREHAVAYWRQQKRIKIETNQDRVKQNFTRVRNQKRRRILTWIAFSSSFSNRAQLSRKINVRAVKVPRHCTSVRVHKDLRGLFGVFVTKQAVGEKRETPIETMQKLRLQQHRQSKGNYETWRLSHTPAPLWQVGRFACNSRLPPDREIKIEEAR